MVKNGDLLAATHGRSFWILDNVALLHQFTPPAFSTPTHLFDPRLSVRFRANAALADRGPAAGNEGRNPPNGVVVQWYTKEAPHGEVTLTFVDPQGQEIRTFSSAATAPRSGGGRAGRGGGGSSVVPTQAGANRFIWDMRYPPANIIPGTTLRGRPNPPLAVPGKYQAKLRIGGQNFTESFDIVKDPRVTVNDADLQEQFKFLIAVRDKLTETHDTVRTIREMRRQAQEAARKAEGTPDFRRLTQAAKLLDDKLYAIEERLSQFRAKEVQDLTNYGNAVDDKLANLLDVAGRADVRPTKSEYDVLNYLSSELKQREESLEAVRKTEWAPFTALPARQR